MASREARFNGHSYFSGGSIVWDVKSVDKLSAIREIVYRSQAFQRIPGLDPARFAEVVIEREKKGSTGFGHGVAIAHGRAPEVTTSQIVLGVSRQGIDYSAIDGEPVQLLFIVANNPTQEMDYLRILSALVSLVRDPAFRQELLDCLSANDLESKLCSAFTALMNGTKHGAAFARGA